MDDPFRANSQGVVALSRELPMDRCLPVEPRGEHYVLAAAWLKSNLDFPSRSELSTLLSKPYQKVSSRVQVGDVQVAAVVYVPADKNEFSFALLKDATDETEQPDILDSSAVRGLEPYLHHLRDRYSYSEGILPEQRCHIDSDFVQPNFLTLSHHVQAKLSWNQARKTDRLLVIGMAGSGKTTLLRRWMLELATECTETRQSVVPIYITLRHWQVDDSVEATVKRQLLAQGAEWAAEHFEPLAKQGLFALALDGLDEIPDDRRDAAISNWHGFISSYHNCRFMVSTRWGAVPNLFEEFTRVELQPFNQTQIQATVYHKLYGRKNWKPFWSRLAMEPRLLELVGNPLILTLLLARYIRNEFAPSYITEALSSIANALIDEWDSTRGVIRSRKTALSPTRKSMLLRYIANHLSHEKKETFTTLEMAEQLRRIASDATPAAVLQLLEESTSIIRRQSGNEWKFRHKVFQEYFACAHWVERLNSKIDDLVGTIFGRSDNRIRWVLRFLTGLSSDASEAFKVALNRAPPYTVHVAICLSEAMTQRLPIEASVTGGYSAYIRLVLDNLAQQAKALNLSLDFSSEAPSIWAVRVIGPENAQSQEWAESFSDLIEVLHRIRDGSALQPLLNALENTSQPSTRALVGLLKAEGRFVSEIASSNGNLMLKAQVQEESPHIPESEISLRTN
jgi:hypothetical protein